MAWNELNELAQSIYSKQFDKLNDHEQDIIRTALRVVEQRKKINESVRL